MSDHAFRRRESEESIDAPDRRVGEAPQTKSIRLPWRRYRISLFWKFGIKVTRPKRTAGCPPGAGAPHRAAGMRSPTSGASPTESGAVAAQASERRERHG